MAAPQSETPRDPIGAFLDALDEVLNSNSFLLDCPIDELQPDAESRLTELIRGPIFKDLLIAADIERGWKNYGEWDWETERYERLHHSGDFFIPDVRLQVARLDYPAARRRMIDLLAHTYSPYHKQLPEADAVAVTDRFLDELLEGDPTGWTFLAVAPDFLHTSGYFGHPTRSPERDDFCYFDGGDADSCTVFHRPGKTFMLLTNGSP